MKDALIGIGLVILAIAVLVGGYYLGLVLAIISAAVIILGTLAFIVFFAVMSVLHDYKERRRRRAR